MVKVYGTGSQPVQERPSQNVARQLAVVLAVCTLALAVCVALISTAELRAARPVAMYGLGSGEEDDADQSQFTAFESMDGSVDVKTEEAVEEVEDAVAVAGKEHEILAAFANDVPDDSTHAPFLSAKEQMGR